MDSINIFTRSGSGSPTSYLDFVYDPDAFMGSISPIGAGAIGSTDSDPDVALGSLEKRLLLVRDEVQKLKLRLIPMKLHFIRSRLYGKPFHKMLNALQAVGLSDDTQNMEELRESIVSVQGDLGTQAHLKFIRVFSCMVEASRKKYGKLANAVSLALK
ncbi:hypothetical protein K0U07_04930 [bacterium]|nr:hypothetical protein [bacterium]